MSNSTLKWIAIVAMFIDHMGAILFGDVMLFRIIGRIAFPIFAFLMTEGYIHTRDVKKYILRLFCFALLSEIPFDLAFHGYWVSFEGQNIFFTLFLGLLGLYCYDYVVKKNRVLSVGVIFIFAIIAYLLRTDYDLFGILTIFAFYLSKKEFKQVVFYIVYINLLMVLNTWARYGFGSSPWNFIQSFGALALPFIYFYNGKKGRPMKYFFYIFYPFHLFVLISIKWLMA